MHLPSGQYAFKLKNGFYNLSSLLFNFMTAISRQQLNTAVQVMLVAA